MHFITDIFCNTLLITGLVMIMLLFIEYINARVAAKGWKMMGKSTLTQVLAATLLGAIPCCVGGFAAVSLFVQGAIGFGALLAALIASMGDEALAMFALFPRQALLLQGLLMLLAIVVGWAVQRCGISVPGVQNHLQSHNGGQHTHCCAHDIHGELRYNLKHITWRRTLLAAGLLLFIAAIAGGMLSHSHEHDADFLNVAEAHNFIFHEYWLNVLFVVLAGIVLIITLRASNHFFAEHLWGHIIKKHFVRIFLWVLCALAVIAVLEHYIEARSWVSQNPLLMLVAALLMGIIPASGPHLVFVLLFAGGNIPFSILLANMLVQDGHASLPLLAESKRGFLYAKFIKLVMAAGIGIIAL
jgi:hypothetical protein